MATVPLGLSAPPSPASLINSTTITISNNNNNLANPISFQSKKFSLLSAKAFRNGAEVPPRSPSFSISPISSGICNASQAVELYPSAFPEIVVREARLEDSWEVAETHCSSFFPNYSFPLDLALRVDRLMAIVAGFSVPDGCRRTCLVGVVGNNSSGDDKFFFGSEEFRVGGFDGKFSFNKGYVAGILTLDTVADFLPRKGPLRQRRTGIAYISNVAVRETDRRKGIAKRLIMKAEAQAKSWGCRAVALHCDISNPGATRLYKGQGFKVIKVPEKANWPQPKTSPNIQFNFMMKLLTTSTTK